MQQLMYVGNGQLAWQEVDTPSITNPTDAIVRPMAVSVCDADRAVLRGRLGREPSAFGHEFVGDVVEVGPEVCQFTIGDRVSVSFKIACGECDRCQKGFSAACRAVPIGSAFGFGSNFGVWGGAVSDAVRVPYADAMMFKLPNTVSYEDAASVGDNLSDALRCVAPGLEHEPGTPVLIMAGGGGAPSISLYAAAIAVALGSEQVDYIDRDVQRLAIAERLGANPIKVDAPPTELGEYIVTADTSGHPSGKWLASTLQATAPYGYCTSCGAYHGSVPVPLGDMYLRGVQFTIGWTNTLDLMPTVLDLLARKCLDVSPIHTVLDWRDIDRLAENQSPKLVLTR